MTLKVMHPRSFSLQVKSLIVQISFLFKMKEGKNDETKIKLPNGGLGVY